MIPLHRGRLTDTVCTFTLLPSVGVRLRTVMKRAGSSGGGWSLTTKNRVENGRKEGPPEAGRAMGA